MKTKAIHARQEVDPTTGSIMPHISISNEERQKIGIYDNLLRLSVGIEDYEDLKQTWIEL
jgi:cystathionine beta-lyase/cystathionine gamma-synthase